MNKIHRLSKSQDILDTIKNNKIIHTPILNLFYRENNKPNWQIAIVAGKKNFKTAVVRNKIKRQVKAIIREVNPQLGNYQIVIIVKVEWLLKTYLDNKIVLNKCLTKLAKESSSNV